jgi:hypothetical protein
VEKEGEGSSKSLARFASVCLQMGMSKRYTVAVRKRMTKIEREDAGVVSVDAMP